MNLQESRTLTIICCLNMVFMLIPIVFILLVKVIASIVMDDFRVDSFNFNLNYFLYFIGVMLGFLWLIDQDYIKEKISNE